MTRRSWMAVPVVVALIAAACATVAQKADGAVAFKEARLITEINATDGDAGLQVFLDHEPWRSISISRPDGQKILDVGTQGAMRDYGWTELFSESSEPSFKEFPLSEFKKRFPEGRYTFAGQTITGTEMRSSVTFTHNFPSGPTISSPADDSTVDEGNVVVRWAPGSQPRGVRLKGFQVLVTRESAPKRVFSADLAVSARSLRIPAEFMEGGVEEYKAEVLAIDVSGNQTLSEVAFSTR